MHILTGESSSLQQSQSPLTQLKPTLEKLRQKPLAKSLNKTQMNPLGDGIIISKIQPQAIIQAQGELSYRSKPVFHNVPAAD